MKKFTWKTLFFTLTLCFSFVLTAGQLSGKDLGQELERIGSLYKAMLDGPKKDRDKFRKSIRDQMEQYVAKNSIQLKSYDMPFKHGHWRVTQGNSTKHTHKKKNQFSWDFELVDDSDNYNYVGIGRKKDPMENYSYGRPIYAVESGKVWLDKGKKDGKGDSNILVVKHKDKMRAIYDHIRPFGFNVEKGDKVRKGELLGYVGFSGTSYSHIHFSIRYKKLDNWTMPIRFREYYLVGNKDGKLRPPIKIENGVPLKNQIIAATLCEANNPSIP